MVDDPNPWEAPGRSDEGPEGYSWGRGVILERVDRGVWRVIEHPPYTQVTSSSNPIRHPSDTRSLSSTCSSSCRVG